MDKYTKAVLTMIAMCPAPTASGQAIEILKNKSDLAFSRTRSRRYISIGR